DGKSTNRLVGVFKTLQPPRVVLVVEPVRPKKQLELPQGAVHVGAFGIRAAHPGATEAAQQRACDKRRQSLGLCLRGGLAARPVNGRLCDRLCSKAQSVSPMKRSLEAREPLS